MRISTKKATVNITAEKVRPKKYAYNENLMHVSFSDTTHVIGESAFYDCKNLITVALPDTLETIGDDAFALCRKVENINLPKKLTEIGARAFWWSGIKKVDIPQTVAKIKSRTFSNCGDLADVTIGNGCKKIGDESFKNCMALQKISLPNTVTEIGKECFAGCSALKSIALPPNLKVLEAGVFKNCSALETVILPEKLEIIDAQCFAHCRALKNVVFPKTLKKIGNKAFYGCSALTEVHLPESTVSIGNCAFYSCKNLNYAVINGNLEFAGTTLFGDCQITPPESVENFYATSFLTERQCKTYPTVAIPENTQSLKLGFHRLLPFAYLSADKTCFEHTLLLKKYKAEVFIGENFYSDEEEIIRNGIFDFARYDSFFEKAPSHERPIIAIFRLTYPVDLSESRRNIYEKELEKAVKPAVLFAVRKNNEDVFKYLADNMNFDSDFCNELYTEIMQYGYRNLLRILSAKKSNTAHDEIAALYREFMI